MYGAGFAQKIELGWKSFLCGPLRISAFSALMGLFNAEGRRDTQRPQRNKSDLPLLCKAADDPPSLRNSRPSPQLKLSRSRKNLLTRNENRNISFCAVLQQST